MPGEPDAGEERAPDAGGVAARLQRQATALAIVAFFLLPLAILLGPLLVFVGARMKRTAAAAGCPTPHVVRFVWAGGMALTALGVLLIPSAIDLIRGTGTGGTTVYVDNSLPQLVTIEVDGKPLRKLLPNALEQVPMDIGKRKIILRDIKGVVVEEHEAILGRTGIKIYNPGATRTYELKVITYGFGDNWTRTFGPGRWHEVREHVDYIFRQPHDTDRMGTKKTWLTRSD